MEEYLNNPYVRIALAIVASSLALSILNLFQTIREGERWYHDNRVLILILSSLFTFLLMDLSQFGVDWQLTTFKMIFVVMISFLVAVTKGQVIVDSIVNMVAKKITKKAQDETPKEPE